MSECKIRFHHDLCIGFFEGKGYSREFTENMTDVIEFLNRENPVTEITLKSDMICRKCPNLRDGICLSEIKVSQYDLKVMELCGMSDGTVIRWSDFCKTVHEKIISVGKLKEVCTDCQWLYICEKKGLHK